MYEPLTRLFCFFFFRSARAQKLCVFCTPDMNMKRALRACILYYNLTQIIPPEMGIMTCIQNRFWFRGHGAHTYVSYICSRFNRQNVILLCARIACWNICANPPISSHNSGRTQFQIIAKSTSRRLRGEKKNVIITCMQTLHVNYDTGRPDGVITEVCAHACVELTVRTCA